MSTYQHATMPIDAPAFVLSPDQLQQFQTQGFIVLPQFASAAFCQQVVDYASQQLAAQIEPIEYEADTRYPGAPASREAEGGHTARRLLRAYARDPLLANFAASGALAAILRQLLGPDALLSQAHHNCIMTKQARYSTATGWHRDSRYWQFQRAELVSSWLALRQETPENGCLLVIPGSHRVEVEASQLDAAQFLRTDLANNHALLAQAQPVPLNAGDLLLFHSNLFHAAGRNQTSSTKLSLVFTYRAQNNPPVAGSRSASLPEIRLG